MPDDVITMLRKSIIGKRFDYDTKLKETGAGKLMATMSRRELCAAGIWAMEQRRNSPSRYGSGRIPYNLITNSIAARKLPWTPEDVLELWNLVRDDDCDDLAMVLRLPIAAAKALPDPLPDWLPEHLRKARRLSADFPGHYEQGQRATMRSGIDALAVRCGLDAAEEGIPDDVFTENDPYGTLVRKECADILAKPSVLRLLAHCRTATGARPKAAWTKRTVELLDARPELADAIRDLLAPLPGLREIQVHHTAQGYEWTDHVYLEQATGDVLRCLIWATAHIDADWVTPLLGDIAVGAGTGMGGSPANSRSEKIANAAVTVLAVRPEESAVSQLSRARAKLRKKTILATVDKALSTVAERIGLTPEQLVERTVPTLGLPASGVREEPLGDYTALLGVTPEATVYVQARNARGKVLTTFPAALRTDHPAELAALRKDAKELKQLVQTERFRVEQALIDGRTWPAGDWKRYYIGHPVTGVHARTLIWDVSTDGGTAWISGIAADGGERLSTVDGGALDVPDGATVRLWHPIRSTVDEIAAWRDRITELRLRQPFKQAFREIYLLTPAEERTGTYSNRFAAHIMRYGQAKALLAQRGWHGFQLGYWEEGELGTATRVYTDAAAGECWRASFDLTLVMEETDDYESPSLCSSDQIRFSRGASGRTAPVADVPALVLTEALRDADLAVGVASIATDPSWADHGEGGRHWDYWQRMSVAELGESAEMRRDALRRLLPRTKVAGRVEVLDRFVRVEGRRGAYKIHIGSGNILTDPGNAYLCIVPSVGKFSQLYLPFEEDSGMLAIILSKVFLLAEDDKITDLSITRQLP